MCISRKIRFDCAPDNVGRARSDTSYWKPNRCVPRGLLRQRVSRNFPWDDVRPLRGTSVLS